MKAEELKLISAGIDIGTTTTQLVISELKFKNKGSSSKMAGTELTHKKIIYESHIYATPILDHKSIDSKRIKEIIKDEYDKAGFNTKDIQTGALIITGETAKKENVKKIINDLAEFAGNFVTAAAGPRLESILAGKGSGAAEFSKKNYKTVINIDIGGGTTNIAIFKDGDFFDSTCLNIGGRLIEVDKYSHIVTYIHKPAQLFIDTFDIDISLGEEINIVCLEELCDKMVSIIEDILKNNRINPQLKDILMGSDLTYDYNSNYIFFSGGVAELIYNIKNIKDDFLYGDIGCYLAKSFYKSTFLRSYIIMKPNQTIRATVIGTGTQTINISGNTVYLDKSKLPIRNIPVIKVKFDNFICENIVNGIKNLVFESGKNYIAIQIQGIYDLSFDKIESLSEAIYKAWSILAISDEEGRLVLIMDKNIGKVLGQTIYRVSDKKLKVISIDSIDANDGDFIDIGEPIAEDDVVPVIIKTLLFS